MSNISIKFSTRKIIVISLLFVGILFVQAQTKVQANGLLPELPGAGITPESTFYFLDRFGEVIQEFFTFNPEAKARLQTAFIAERISEARAMLGKEKINKKAVETAFERMREHRLKLGDIIREITIQEKEAFVASIVDVIDPLDDVLEAILEEAEENADEAIELEKRRIEQKLDDPAFVAAMESALRGIAEKIDREIGQPLEGFQVVEDSVNVDVDDDTYSATYRAEAGVLVDLAVLRDRMLAGGIEQGWESGDVVLDDDSLDITFEKAYGAITIEGETLYSEASVTISATQHSPETGMTAINYDIDITLEGESENLLDFLKKQKKESDDNYDALTDELEGQMGLQKAAERAVREAEEEKHKIIKKVVKKGVELPANAFVEFDGLLAQAKNALQAGNHREVKQFIDRAESALERIEGTIEELEKQKEFKEDAEEAEEAIQEAEEKETEERY